jgi:hypothetical protein
MAIPVRCKKYIAKEWKDSDGYWIALAPGLMDGENPHCHQIHEDTKAQAYEVLKSVERCTCPEHASKLPCGCLRGNCRCAEPVEKHVAASKTDLHIVNRSK